MRIGVVGLGYAGTATAAALQYAGPHAVVAYDADAARRRRMDNGAAAGCEPALARYLPGGDRYRGSVDVVDSCRAAVAGQDCVMVCVGTPAAADGGVDAGQLETALADIARHADVASPPWIVVRSTALPAVHVALTAALSAGLRRRYVVHPEFAREGSMVDDFLGRGVDVFGAGAARRAAVERLAERLYPAAGGCAAPRVVVSVAAAALVKYATNALHAAKVALANEIGVVCAQWGADAGQVMAAVLRATPAAGAYLVPGMPYGGSCLPKDTAALGLAGSAELLPLLRAVEDSNERHKRRLAAAALAMAPPGRDGPARYGVYGLAFKPGTEDCRASPAVHVAATLLRAGHAVAAYDGLVRRAPLRCAGLSLKSSAAALADADVLVVCHPPAPGDAAMLDGATVLDGVGMPAALVRRARRCRGLHEPHRGGGGARARDDADRR